ncbi:MAG: ammonium transporter [Actinobacteria bacterium]|nr:ammonium transporter [Actinomycetota bacterium]
MKRAAGATAVLTVLLWLTNAGIAAADSTGTDLGEKIPGVDKLTHGEIGLNLLWIIVGAVLVIFMQAGFALVETGFCRAKHAAHVVSTNFAIFGLGFVGFYLVGYSFMFGGYSFPGLFGYDKPVGGALIGSGHWVFLWKGGWALSGAAYSVPVMAFFLYMVAFMDTTATIPTGAMAERWKWNSFVIWGLFCGSIFYPLFGAWTWGGGWLSQLGNSLNLGFGYVDFAGSGVVHMMGGVAGLAGALVLGPRIGKYGPDGKPRTLAAHHIPMALLGTFILLVGWFGFNAASTFGATDLRFTVVAANTAIAAAFGATIAMFWVMLRAGKPDPGMMANGMLAGLVAITAPCAFVQPWAAAVIGAIAAVLVVESVWFFERKAKIDDPVGAISVHGVGGAFGVLCVGIFSDGSYGAGWNLTTTAGKGGVKGILYGGTGAGQLAAQAAGVVTIGTVMFGLALLFFFLQNKLTKGGIRPTAEVEIGGVDIPEMGVLAYPEFYGSSIHVELSEGVDGHRPMPEPVPVGQERSR